jgi:60 kDa SS-A/Ro ribonucleoprotein
MAGHTPFAQLKKKTPQSEPLLGEQQIANNAGGFVYELDPWKAFLRFLVLGTEGGTYYASETKLTREAAETTLACIEEDGPRAVKIIVEVSDAGRAPKNDPAIFALALAASAKSVSTRQLALAALPKVCRIPTHLFHFNTFVEQFRGRGQTLNRAMRHWYQDKAVDDLAYQMVKYQARG